MNFFKDGLGYLYQCVSEVDFGDVIVEWWNYRHNVPAIKQLGGVGMLQLFMTVRLGNF